MRLVIQVKEKDIVYFINFCCILQTFNIVIDGGREGDFKLFDVVRPVISCSRPFTIASLSASTGAENKCFLQVRFYPGLELLVLLRNIYTFSGRKNTF